MDIDARLCVVPWPAGSTVLIVRAVATAVACVLVVEDIVDLAKQLDVRAALVLLQRQGVLQVHIRCSISFDIRCLKVRGLPHLLGVNRLCFAVPCDVLHYDAFTVRIV